MSRSCSALRDEFIAASLKQRGSQYERIETGVFKLPRVDTLFVNAALPGQGYPMRWTSCWRGTCGWCSVEWIAAAAGSGVSDVYIWQASRGGGVKSKSTSRVGVSPATRPRVPRPRMSPGGETPWALFLKGYSGSARRQSSSISYLKKMLVIGSFCVCTTVAAWVRCPPEKLYDREFSALQLPTRGCEFDYGI